MCLCCKDLTWRWRSPFYVIAAHIVMLPPWLRDIQNISVDSDVSPSFSYFSQVKPSFMKINLCGIGAAFIVGIQSTHLYTLSWFALCTIVVKTSICVNSFELLSLLNDNCVVFNLCYLCLVFCKKKCMSFIYCNILNIYFCSYIGIMKEKGPIF